MILCFLIFFFLIYRINTHWPVNQEIVLVEFMKKEQFVIKIYGSTLITVNTSYKTKYRGII